MAEDLHSLGEQIAEDAAHIDAAHHRLLTRVRLFDEGGGWYAQGFRTCAQWLAWRVGWGPGTAREHVRVAAALGKRPLIDEALRKGELSFSKVRALTRVATTETEAELVEFAKLMTGHQLETLCRKYAGVRRHDADATRPDDDHDRRYIIRRDTDDGMVLIEAALHPEEAAVVWTALQQLAKERCRKGDPARSEVGSAEGCPENVSAGTSRESGSALDSDSESKGSVMPSRAASEAGSANEMGRPPADRPQARERPAFDRADALVQMAQAVLRGDSPHRAPTEIVIAIPIETLKAQHNDDLGAVACCSDGTAISAVAARRLACDAGIVTIVDDEHGSVLAVGRKRRTITGSMKRAMLRRDQTCRFPGCSTRVFLEGHHMQHWADGGETSLANILAVCSYHHRFLHEYGFTIELAANGSVVAHDRHGRPIPELAPSPHPPDLGWENVEHRNARLGITSETIECWDGIPVDYGLLIDVLVQCEDKAATS